MQRMQTPIEMSGFAILNCAWFAVERHFLLTSQLPYRIATKKQAHQLQNIEVTTTIFFHLT
jgi:hypothetical protein